MDEPETIEMVRLAQRQDSQAWDALLQRFMPRLLERVEIMMGEQARRHAEKDDVVQSVAIEIVRDLGQFEPRGSGSFLRWACQIARNHIRDEVRRKHERAFESFAADSQELPVEGNEPTPSSDASLEEQKERLADALLDMAEDYRTVVKLRYFQGMKFAAIGEQMGRSENAVMLLHTRALLRLGALLRQRDGAG